jgi:hypothetical protein
VLNAATLGTLTPVTSIDPKEFSRLITLNLFAPQALIAAFDPLLRRSEAARSWRSHQASGKCRALIGEPMAPPRRRWRRSCSAMPRRWSGCPRSGWPIVDPGATATVMRARAFPGEDPATIKQPAVVGERIAALLQEDFATGARVRIDA